MQSRLLLVFCFLSIVSFGQQNTLWLHTYMKDRLFDNSRSKAFVGNGFLPTTEATYDLNGITRDSSVQYYDFTEILFKKHLIEATGSNYHISISPVLDMGMGRDLADTSKRNLFQNTRGLIVEGDLFKNFSFMTAFFENQGRYSRYESAYYSLLGELYPNQAAGIYVTQNAVIPGAGRTKPFKTDGFDYGYAMGNIVYTPHRSITLMAGNTPHFIGDGYRSILLSDNAAPAPFFRGTFRFLKKFEFNYLRTRLINLMRKPGSTTVEAYYETKGFSVNYLSYNPIEKLSISLFEGVVWSKGDSIASRSVHPLFYNPVPFLANAFLNDSLINSVIGVNVSALPFKSHRFYGQFAIGQLDPKKFAFQLGYRGYNFFGFKEMMLQTEYNSVSAGMYQSQNERLNYSHYNLPLALVKGAGFQEALVRINVEVKRIYLDLKSVYYVLSNHQDAGLLPVRVDNELKVKGNIFLQQVELGYRFNRKMNLMLFVNWQYRNSVVPDSRTTNMVFGGIRTGINNHYNDF